MGQNVWKAGSTAFYLHNGQAPGEQLSILGHATTLSMRNAEEEGLTL